MTQAALPASAPAAPPRPATVTAAFALQCALVASLLLMIGTVLAGAVRYNALIEQAVRATGTSGELAAAERAGNVSSALMAAVPMLVLAVWLASTAVGLRRGSNVAWILTLVGLAAPLLLGALFCLVGGVFGVLIGFVLAASDSSDPPDVPMADGDTSRFYDELQRLDSGGWSIAFGVLGTTSAVVAVLLAIATGVLLLTGASTRYFRPQRPVPWPPYSTYWTAPAYSPPAPAPYPYPPAYGQPSFWHSMPAPPTPPPNQDPNPPAAPPPPQPPPAG